MKVEESEASPAAHSLSRYDESIFRKAVVAAAFSPRLTAVLNEAHRILCAFGAEAVLVHVGDAGRQSEEKLRKIAASTKIWELQPSVMLREGNPGDELPAAAAELGADLIIAGALAKEGLFKYYLGSVARTLAREAPCSVFLLTEPTVNGHTFQRIHCAVEYQKGAEKAPLAAGILAAAEQSRHLYFTHSFTSEALQKENNLTAEQIRNIYREQDLKLAEYLASLRLPYQGYQHRCLHDPERTLTLAFTRDLGADLLVMHGPTNRFSLWNRLFFQDLDGALQHLPCSLLLTK